MSGHPESGQLCELLRDWGSCAHRAPPEASCWGPSVEEFLKGRMGVKVPVSQERTTGHATLTATTIPRMCPPKPPICCPPLGMRPGQCSAAGCLSLQAPGELRTEDGCRCDAVQGPQDRELRGSLPSHGWNGRGTSSELGGSRGPRSSVTRLLCSLGDAGNPSVTGTVTSRLRRRTLRLRGRGPWGPDDGWGAGFASSSSVLAVTMHLVSERMLLSRALCSSTGNY